MGWGTITILAYLLILKKEKSSANKGKISLPASKKGTKATVQQLNQYKNSIEEKQNVFIRQYNFLQNLKEQHNGMNSIMQHN